MQQVLGAVASRLSAVQRTNLMLFKGEVGSSASSPSQSCGHTEMLGVWRSPLPELQTTTGTLLSHPRTPASPPATHSCKEPACETWSGQPKWLEQPRSRQQDRQVLALGHSLAKPLSPKAAQEDQEPSSGSFFRAVETPCPFTLPFP